MMSAYLMLAATPLFWAGNWVIARVLVTRVSPLEITFVRWVLGAAVLMAASWRKERGLPRLQGWLVPGVAVAGLLGMVGYTLLQYESLRHTQAVNGTLIFTATPAFTFVLAALLLGERWGPWQAAGLVLTLAGVAVILSGGEVGSLRHLRFNPGDSLMVAADWVWAGYTVVTKALARRAAPLALTAWSMVAAAVLLFPAQLWEWASGQGGLTRGGWGWGKLGALAYIGVFASALAYLWWGEGIRRVGAGAGSVFGNLLPVYTAVLAGLFLGERLTAADVVGGIAVMAGVYLTARPRDMSVRSPSPPVSRSWDESGAAISCSEREC